jgi:hypothetical protein
MPDLEVNLYLIGIKCNLSLYTTMYITVPSIINVARYDDFLLVNLYQLFFWTQFYKISLGLDKSMIYLGFMN